MLSEQNARDFFRLAVASRLGNHQEQPIPRGIHRQILERGIHIYELIQASQERKPATLEEALARYDELQRLLVSPDIEPTLSHISEEIPFQRGEGLAVVGSMANGGAQIRRLAGTYEPHNQRLLFTSGPDVDTVLVRPQSSQTSLTLIRETTARQIQEAGYDLCSYYNPKGYIIEYPDNPSEMVRWLQRNSRNKRDLVFAFSTIYPHEAGIMYRQLALQSLQVIARENPHEYEKIKDVLESNMKRYFLALQRKYFSPKVMHTHTRGEESVQAVNEAMYGIFADVLEKIKG